MLAQVFNRVFSKPSAMKKVYFKGHPYEFQVRNTQGGRVFALYQDGSFVREVAQSDLDIKSVVSLILEEYYQEITSRDMKPSF
jgi:hypothetical protein